MTSLDTTITSVFNTDAWAIYEADLQFTGRLAGGNPSDPEIVEGWLRTKLGITDEDQLRAWTLKHLAETRGIDPTTATDEDIEKAIAENAAEKKAQIFKRTPDGRPYIEGRHAKAMLKEATSIAYPRGANKFGRYQGKNGPAGGKDPKAYVAERVFVPERPIVVADDTDGIDLAVGHIKEWNGETRSTLGYYEYCVTPTVTIEVHVFDDCLEADQWARIWTLAELNGLGARRSQGAGQFVVTRWERIN